jgi:hypothetical protein
MGYYAPWIHPSYKPDSPTDTSWIHPGYTPDTPWIHHKIYPGYSIAWVGPSVKCLIVPPSSPQAAGQRQFVVVCGNINYERSHPFFSSFPLLLFLPLTLSLCHFPPFVLLFILPLISNSAINKPILRPNMFGSSSVNGFLSDFFHSAREDVNCEASSPVTALHCPVTNSCESIASTPARRSCS